MGVTYTDHRRLRQLVLRENVQMIGTIVEVVEIRAVYAALFRHVFRTGFRGAAKVPQDRCFGPYRIRLEMAPFHQNDGKNAPA